MGDEAIKEEVLEKLGKLTAVGGMALTSSGDAAIEAAMIAARELGYKKLLIPDQGGWFSYRKLPNKVGIEAEELKTDHGVVIPEELKKHSGCAFIFTTLAGYFAEQPLNRIYGICKRNKIFLIEDSTGSIGWKRSKADIIVASFSEWKPINLGYGGVIAAKDSSSLSLPAVNAFLDTNKFDKDDLLDKLISKIDGLAARYKFFFALQKKVKKDLRKFEVIHRRLKGINVVAAYSSEEEKNKLLDYCAKNSYEPVNCPSYIKVNVPAVSIELKRLEEK